MERQILWLSKHLAIVLQKNILTFASRCKQKRVSGSGPISPTGPKTGLTGSNAGNPNSAVKDDLVIKAGDQDWRVPLISYLRYPGRGAERNIRHLEFKYILIDDELYCQTAEDLLLMCLDLDQARVAMGEVHEGICGTHQSAPKMKWLLN